MVDFHRPGHIFLSNISGTGIAIHQDFPLPIIYTMYGILSLTLRNRRTLQSSVASLTIPLTELSVHDSQ